MEITFNKILCKIGLLLLACSFVYAQENQANLVQSETTSSGASKSAAKKNNSDEISWKGFYFGGNIGKGWGKGDTSFNPLPDAATFASLKPITLALKPSGVKGGFQVGYNFQAKHFVFGGEFDLSGAKIEESVTKNGIVRNNDTVLSSGTALKTSQKTDRIITLRPRAGVAFKRIFIYGTIGGSFAKINYSADTNFNPDGFAYYPTSFSKNKKGWAGGVGGEVALSKHFSIKAEYLHHKYDDETVTVNQSVNTTLAPGVTPSQTFKVNYVWVNKINTFTMGFNIRF